MNIFDDEDRNQLVAPADLFDREGLIDEHGQWGHQLLRAATAMETLAQITQRGAQPLLKGGTLLQHSIAWPPHRASVDLDLETRNAHELGDVLQDIQETFQRSDVRLTIEDDTPLPGFTAHLRFPRSSSPNWFLRVDVLENDDWPTRSGPWGEIPGLWDKAPAPIAADAEVRAAQKLLLAAEPHYGRDLDDHRGRQNFVKDLFDLYCLGQEALDGTAVDEAAREDVDRKSGYLGERYAVDEILEQAKATFRHFARPPADDGSMRGSLWRAYERVRGTIRIGFTQADLRTAAGCAHHCIQAIERDHLGWEDAWRPTDRRRRAAWEAEETIQPVVEVEDDYGTIVGPREAWAEFEP